MFQPNIKGKGRVLRGLIAVALFGSAIFATEAHWGIRIALACAGVFVAFEALRGWCALRACGIRTKI
jgi:hypothetical protein